MSDVLKQFRDTTPYRAPSRRSAATNELVAIPFGDEGAFVRAGLPLVPVGVPLATIEHGIVLHCSDSFPSYRINSTAQRLCSADSERVGRNAAIAPELHATRQTARH